AGLRVRDDRKILVPRGPRRGTIDGYPGPPRGPAMPHPLVPVVNHVRRAATGRTTDAALLDQFLRTRDDAAFTSLVRRHGPTVLAACRQVLSDPADVEDAFQQTFLAFWRKADAIRQRPSVGSWLFGVAHRLAVKT